MAILCNALCPQTTKDSKHAMLVCLAERSTNFYGCIKLNGIIPPTRKASIFTATVRPDELCGNKHLYVKKFSP